VIREVFESVVLLGSLSGLLLALTIVALVVPLLTDGLVGAGLAETLQLQLAN
jgi:hypothetical protein